MSRSVVTAELSLAKGFIEPVDFQKDILKPVDF